MPRKTEPISDEELSGLIMAVTAEAGRAQWRVRYGIQPDGSLFLHIRHPDKKFVFERGEKLDADRLVIVPITAEVVTDT